MTGEIGPYPCLSCRHRIEPDSPVTGVGPVACAQYPAGIPLDILGGAPHDELRGDEAQGRHFEVDPPKGYLERAWRAWRELVAGAS